MLSSIFWIAGLLICVLYYLNIWNTGCSSNLLYEALTDPSAVLCAKSLRPSAFSFLWAENRRGKNL